LTTAAPAQSVPSNSTPAPIASSFRPPLPLAALPKAPSIEVAAPAAAVLEALDRHLARLVASDAAERETAAREILEVEPDRLPAIHRRLTTISESSDHEGMKQLLGGTRDKARDALKQRVRAEGKGEKVSTPDYLEMLLSHPRIDSRPYRDLVAVVAMSRMLRQIGTTPAARELVSIYARFGEFLRVDTQLELEQLGERSVAALVEAERHPAPKIAQWAARQLDALGKGIPSETVQTNDPEVLADVLRAHGRARNPEAARLVISFVSSERAQIRDAARQAVVLMGEVANWQLRDTYENIVGKKPPREWSWDRTARELFSEFDRLRLAPVYELFDQGVAAQRAGKMDEMARAWDQVLAQSPTFERGTEMAAGYHAYAQAHLDDKDPNLALKALERVDRLASDSDPLKRSAESLRLTLEAQRLFARHIADQTLLRRALDLDARNARAKHLLERITRGDADTEHRRYRYVAAGAILALSLGGLVFILLRRRAPSATT
jgi:tetratricopeptide (TPR) repeat protein